MQMISMVSVSQLWIHARITFRCHILFMSLYLEQFPGLPLLWHWHLCLHEYSVFHPAAKVMGSHQSLLGTLQTRPSRTPLHPSRSPSLGRLVSCLIFHHSTAYYYRTHSFLSYLTLPPRVTGGILSTLYDQELSVPCSMLIPTDCNNV